jgi:hypothetical protein
MHSLFDSESERKAYSTVLTRWSRFLDVYPHIPVRNAVGYDKLMSLPITDKAKGYLLKTEFDFVVCDRSGSPILAVEFDGLGHGFSRDGEYIQVVEVDDQYRKLKLDAKISACEWCDLPVVIVSYPETDPSFDPDCPVTVLDAVIGEVLSARELQELVNSELEQLGAALETDPSGESASLYLTELEVIAEQANPVRRRIQEMQRRLPVSFGLQFYPLRDRPGYVGARRWILGGIELSGQVSRQQVLLSYDVYVRTVNCSSCSAFQLADLLAEYGLTRKAIRTVGTSPDAWHRLLEETPWTEYRC